jgi:methyl-accepting chemotaxis protein
MANSVGSGQAVGTDPTFVGAEAARMALAQLGDARPAFGFVFAAPTLPLGEVLQSVRSVVQGAQILGCSTAGEITERGLTHGGVAVLLVASDLHHFGSTAAGLGKDPESAALEMCGPFALNQAAARKKGMFCSTSIALVDGLCGSGERFVESMVSNTAALHQVVGGAAGDEGKFRETQVGFAGRVGSDRATALHVFDRTPWGIGIGHGLEPTTGRMVVTRAKGNVVHEIEGRPAFAVYEDHARTHGVTLRAESAGEYMIGNELGIIQAGVVSRARAPLSVGADGSLTCAASIPQGAYVAILDGKPDAMVQAASSAAQEALAGLQGREPAGVLLFDCICRGLILKDQFRREIDAVRAVVGDVPVAGFLTYGEIASYSGRLESWHNTTAVALVIPK